MRNDWDTVAGLADGTRRRLYDHVRSQRDAVSREDAARALQISRSLAAFHLDKLVEIGLLTARKGRPSGVTRGRGRPPKVYAAEPQSEVSVTLPERRYRLMAEILAKAVADDPGHAGGAALRIARETGRQLGAEYATVTPVELVGTLDELGYRPRSAPGGALELTNCPFAALAARHATLVCGLNRAFVAGVVDGLGADGVNAEPHPQHGGCCVELVVQA